MSAAERTLVIAGGGLAGRMTALGLARSLSDACQIVLLEDAGDARYDLFYGSVTAPTGYEFYRTLGLAEPTLFLNSATSFSYGTLYQNWPATNADWLQCHHLTFPVISGVPLQHHLTQHGAPLEPLLISAQAARRGVFAHPPQDRRSALSRAEYGYQFSDTEWTALLGRALDESQVRRVSGDIAEIETDGGHIRAVRVSTGEHFSGDLYIDCTGPARRLANAVGGSYLGERDILASRSEARTDRLGSPHRTVEANGDGWDSTSQLVNAMQTLRVRDASQGQGSGEGLSVSLGRLDQPWRGNCVAIGHSAAVLEPLTVAPMMLLQRDIERLLDLVPALVDQDMERREFNRRFENDVTHAGLFQAAFFRLDEKLDTPYWSAAQASARSEALDRKIDQFENRGLLVRYDLEPFDDEDWMILHAGMGRRPYRYDRQLDGHSATNSARQLSDMKQAVEQTVSRMPPHEIYVANLKRYLEKQSNV